MYMYCWLKVRAKLVTKRTNELVGDGGCWYYGRKNILKVHYIYLKMALCDHLWSLILIFKTSILATEKLKLRGK